MDRPRGNDCPATFPRTRVVMEVTRLHAKLFEAAALDLDRQIRAQFVGENVRAPYLKSLDNQPEGMTPPDFLTNLGATSRAVDAGVEVKGRFLFLKRAVRRVMRPFMHHQNAVHRLHVERF